MARFFDGLPAAAPVVAVSRDPFAHLVIPWFGGGQVEHGAARPDDKPFRQPRFSGPRPSQHKRERGQRENM
jgi:hypothetical protein